jgi:glycosyltransferase involved in cell wall biosynthesis
MKIGFFTDAYTPTGFGVAVSIETFRKNLQKMGHKVYIFAPHYPNFKEKNPYVFRFPSLKAIKEPEMRFGLPLLSPFQISKILNIKLDIVHAHTPFSLGFLGKFIATFQKIPLFYTHHTDYEEYAKFYIKEKLITPYLAKILVAIFSNLADAVIAPSPKIKKYLISQKVKKPIYILPTGINLKIFKKSAKNKKESRKKLGISPTTKILLYVGRMGKEKNVGFLLRAFKEIKKRVKFPLIFFLVGTGPYLDKFRQMGDNLKISQFLNFVGPVPHQEIPNFYQMADLFVFSSLTDTQGIVILEATASGLPVVALKDDAFKEFVISGKNGFLIKKNSPRFFGEKIREILENPQLYKKFSATSLKIAKQFSEKSQAEKLIKIYKEVIKKKISN